MTIVQMGRITATEAGDRNATALLLPTDGTQLGVVQGVQSGLTLTKTSGMGWQLDLGRCVIAPATAANGPVVAAVTVAETGSFAAGDATRDRIDIVALQIDETATTANGNPPVKTVVIQGAYPASGSPAAPPVPAGTIGLWQETIAAGTSAGGGGWNTANLVDLRTKGGLGGPLGQIGQLIRTTLASITSTNNPLIETTVNVQANRKIKVTFRVDGNPNADLTYAAIGFLTGGTAGTTGGTPIRATNLVWQKNAFGQGNEASATTTTTAAGPLRFSVNGQVVAGGTTINIPAATTGGMSITIEDCGAV